MRLIPRLLRRLPLLSGACLLLFSGTAATLRADTRPVSVQEICLMLRSGFSGAEVLQETAARPLLEPLTPDAEKQLLAAGAAPGLVTTLRTGHAALSASDAEAARQQRAAQDQRAFATAIHQAEMMRAQGTPAAKTPGAPGANPTSPTGDPHAIENLFSGKLVTFRDENVKSANGDALQGKTMIGLYYSRYMSKAGSGFSNDLAQFYRDVTSKHPEFEVILVSGDPSAYAMENTMRRARMPWLALAFDQIAKVPIVSRFNDNTGASRLIIIDNFSRIHADYRISVMNNNLPMVLPDLLKVIENPTRASALAPPEGSGGRGAPPARAQ